MELKLSSSCGFPAFRRKLRKLRASVRARGLYAVSKDRFLHIFEDWPLLGRLAGLLGPFVRLDNLEFLLELDDLEIETRLRSRFLTGTWETEMRYLVKKYLPVELPVIELGACIGVVSCITNQLLTEPCSHVVVEANPHLMPMLYANRLKNACRFKIIHAALAYTGSRVEFHLNQFNEGSTLFHTDASPSLIVPATTLASVLHRERFSRISLIADIEGGEHELVVNEGELMRERVKWFFVELHDQGRAEETHRKLETLGFTLVETFRHNRTYRNEGLADKRA